jgi:ElaB/YqjD/DUF883 family membrane-anchored ribosome-binding protein
MFGKQNTRARKAERIAGLAWDRLVTTVDNAGAATKSATRTARRHAVDTADDVSDRLGSSAHEARQRASRAYDALAGRKPARPWGWLAGAAAAGAVLGWLGTLFGRKLAARSDVNALERSVTDLPTPDRATIPNSR